MPRAEPIQPEAAGPLEPAILPCELLQGLDASRAVADGRAYWLAGGPIAFSAALSIEPGDTGERRSRRLAIGEIDPRRRDLLGAPRPSLAGVALSTTRLMGIVNATPDSFTDAGAHARPAAAIAHGKALIAAGADFLDIGGESTRPGAAPVDMAEEMARVVPVIEGLKEAGVPLSIDTRNAGTMRAAVKAGAAMVNDISALSHDPDSAGSVADLGLPVILCHSRGTPASMRECAAYGDVALEVRAELQESIEKALATGITRQNIVIDPGLGFAKKPEHNARLLSELALLHGLGCAILVGASGKNFTRAAATERLGASLAAGLAAIERGAQILRVHDVAASVQAIEVHRAIVGA